MIEISNLRIPLDRLDGTEEGELAVCRRAVARKLGIREGRIRNIELRRRSIDARKRSSILITFTVRLSVDGDETALTRNRRNNARLIDKPSYGLPTATRPYDGPRPVVVGAGCAGLFCALALASAGMRPLLVERGDDAERRTDAVRRFEQTGELDTQSNIQFGIGGAGTFSDGKLSTGTKSPAHRLILEALVNAGAQRRILWDAKPHVGSDVLPSVVTQLVQRIEELGGEVRFRTRLTGIGLHDGRVRNVTLTTTAGDEHVDARDVVLACGHSARDVFALLRDAGVALERKTFAMGVRIEHVQREVDRALYGSSAGHPALGAGAGTNANAALLANVFPTDLAGDDVLAGVELQRRCEQMAYEMGGGGFVAPAQLVGDFLQQGASSSPGRVEPTYPRGVTWANVGDALPSNITDTLRAALPRMARKLYGFDAADAVLTGVETRSSSPVRVTRGDDGQSVNTRGLWPCGEGAGYAGGIMSAATDGLNTAEALIRLRAGSFS